MDTAPPLRNPVLVGQRFMANLPEGKKLFVNNRHQCGVWIEEEPCTGAANAERGITSGELDPDSPIKVIRWHEEAILVLCTLRDSDNPGEHEAAIDVALFRQYFAEASSPHT